MIPKQIRLCTDNGPYPRIVPSSFCQMVSPFPLFAVMHRPFSPLWPPFHVVFTSVHGQIFQANQKLAVNSIVLNLSITCKLSSIQMLRITTNIINYQLIDYSKDVYNL